MFGRKAEDQPAQDSKPSRAERRDAAMQRWHEIRAQQEADRQQKEIAKVASGKRVRIASGICQVSSTGTSRPAWSFYIQGQRLLIGNAVLNPIRYDLASLTVTPETDLQLRSGATLTRSALFGAAGALARKTQAEAHTYLHLVGGNQHTIWETPKAGQIASTLQHYIDEIRGSTTTAAELAQRPSSQPTSGVPSPPASPPMGIPDQIRELAQLRDAGLLTDVEFETKKTELLTRM